MKEKIKKKALINVLATVANDRRKGLKMMQSGFEVSEKELAEHKRALAATRKILDELKKANTEGLAEQYKAALAEIEQCRTIFAAIRCFVPFNSQEELVDAIAKLTTPPTIEEASNVREFPLRDVANSQAWDPSITPLELNVEGFIGAVPEVVKQATADFQAESEIQSMKFNGEALELSKVETESFQRAEEFDVYTKLISKGCAHDAIVGLSLGDKKQILHNLEMLKMEQMPTQQEQ